MRYKLNPLGFVLFIIFTVIEVVGLFYWLAFGNTGLGVAILIISLLAEHFVSASQGAIAPLFIRNEFES